MILLFTLACSTPDLLDSGLDSGLEAGTDDTGVIADSGLEMLSQVSVEARPPSR